MDDEFEFTGPGPCARCGSDPAKGFASTWNAKDGEQWLCHGDDDESPTCYDLGVGGNYCSYHQKHDCTCWQAVPAQ